ncbi:endoxylanase [Photobacterium proteolyticum]|uniref:Endoxylanase n=1 Tax=Photobacterium proteolyticum TaxID=1903952 RepID=A0A1Q9GEU6_9GAMM|nr:CBM9 family sugar-binding protein [Photobacterium proteolyticum]OLQ72913.1 endoxylanase [Photobacterium proteolyticum]
MKKILGFSAMLVGSLVGFQSLADEAGSRYMIHFADQVPVIDGKGQDLAWDNAQPLSEFTFPWSSQAAPSTEFRALWDRDAIYFRYVLEDEHLAVGKDPERGVLDSDRAEIFLAKDPQLSSYYTLEIDPKARVFSADAAYDPVKTKRVKLDSSWNWPGLVTKASSTASGYIVEAKLPLTTITDLGLWQDNAQSELICALMRAEFTPKPDGSIDMGWMTWIDPNTAKPNFHNPGTFGTCKLVK